MRTPEEIDAKVKELEDTAQTYPLVTNAITILNTYRSLDLRKIRAEIISLKSRFEAYDKILARDDVNFTERRAAQLARSVAMCRGSALLWLIGKVDEIVKQDRVASA